MTIHTTQPPSPTPLVITAHLVGPVAYHPDEGITLDGPLCYAATVERLGHACFGPAPGNDVIAAATATPDPDVPLGAHGTGDAWTYCCSLAEPVGAAGTERLHWHKRFDDALAMRALEANGLATTALRVNPGSGEFKGYRMPLYVEHAEALRWYAIGEPVALERRLTAHVHHLGKRQNAGFGVVASWTVEPWAGRPDRWLWVDDARTQLARAVPLAWLPDWAGESGMAGTRPPYWLAAHQQRCALPVAVDVDAPRAELTIRPITA